MLLRFVVIHLNSRRGHGAAVVRALETRAAALWGDCLPELTTTAVGFFLRLDYAPAARKAAAAAIAATVQCALLCPASASYLVKSLSAWA